VDIPGTAGKDASNETGRGAPVVTQPQPESLGHISRLNDLSNDELQKVVNAGRHFTLPAEWSLIWEGTAADKAYLIVNGEVSVRKQGEEIARLGPGDVIGEMGIVEQKLRSASVVSLTALEVIHFTREGLEQLIRDVPAFGEALRGTAQDRRHGS
jgi:CRP/FNR family cyclic AMP-dependent transcriptional regulator